MIDEPKKIFGERMRVFRKHLGLTLEAFAKPLSIKGNTVSDYERGKARASEAVLRELEMHYQLNRTWYETGEGAMRLPITGTSHESLHLGEKAVGIVGPEVIEPPTTFPTPLHQMFWETVLKLTEDEMLEELLILRRKQASRDKKENEGD